MTIQEIAESIVADRGPIILVIMLMMTFVEVTPIKLNPWTAIFNWFGRRLNKEVTVKIDKIEDRLEHHIKESEEGELKARRMSILDFSSSIIRGVNYHKEKFDFMINECDQYEQYIIDNKVKNGVAEASIAEIRRIYQEHLRNHDFLVESEPLPKQQVAAKHSQEERS